MCLTAKRKIKLLRKSGITCKVTSAQNEQWELVVNEAMAAGLPVLVSERCGCAMDLVQTGVNGFQFDPCSESSMADALFRIHKLPDADKQVFGQKSREIIADWGPARFADGLSQAVTKAMGGGTKKNAWLAKVLLRLILQYGMK